MLNVERIGHAVLYSAAASILSLWVYLGLLFMLFFMTTALENDAALAGFVAGIAPAWSSGWCRAGHICSSTSGGKFPQRHKISLEN